MKFIFVFLFCLSVFAQSPEDLGSNYPGFQDYEAIAFSGLRTYFRDLYQKSYVASDVNGIKTIVVLNANQTEALRINAKIERKIDGNQFFESVIYALPNGKILDYTLKREVLNFKPLSDLDLLMFKFQDDEQMGRYEILSKALGFVFYREKNEKQEKAYFNLAFMEFIVEIDTVLNIKNITRDYLYFYKNMPNPQSQLTVKAEGAQGDWGGVQYTHYSRARGAGEITPRDFFSGLNEGAGAFGACVEIFPDVLYGIGFPRF